MSADLRTALRTRLLANATLSSEVGGNRIYPVRLPDGVTYPALSFQKISDLTEPHLGGASRIKRARLQVDTWADTPDKAWELADLVRTQLDGFNGVVDGVQFASSIIGSETDLYEDGIERYRVTSDYEVSYYAA